MASYETAKARAFAHATTTVLTGVPLDAPEDHPLRQAGSLPIQVCVCVTDPCPCDGHPIIWADEAAVRSRATTGRLTSGGDEVFDFAIDVDASVVVETFSRVKASEAAGLTGAARPAAPPPYIVRRRPDAARSARRDSPCHGGGGGPATLSADAGCNDIEITESGVTYCFAESSEHYCIYVLC